ncbi:MAG: Xaa-Pro aminopeptidase [Propionibacteriaceae bacterium]|nr:Xaa-Pro aminopeptidase [Propionibacteriaceae bacterium]
MRRKPPHSGKPRPKLSQVGAFTQMIAQDWEVGGREAQIVPGAAQAAEQHRNRLSAAIGQRDVVIFSGHAPLRNNDCYFEYRADSSFVWLTGAAIEFACLILRANGKSHDAELYLKPPARPGVNEFFSSAAYGELWVGPSPGLNDWETALGIRVTDISELASDLEKLENPCVSGTLSSDELTQYSLLATGEVDKLLSDLRMYKDAWEIEQLQAAVAASVGGFEAVAAELTHAIEIERGERWLQGTFDRHARTFGNGPGFTSIAGSGPHAPTLHWIRCDGPIIADMPLLLDMGVETYSLYTADITRTIPPTGHFSPAGRQVHDLVAKAHRAALAAAVNRAHFLDAEYAAMEVIAGGLHDWGILKVSVDEALSPDGQQHRRYIVCGVSHHLGLDVHDCAKSDSAYDAGLHLAPGMVFTVEPGVYFHAHDLTLPPELRGVGVRIEDDVWIRPDGAQQILTDALPFDTTEVEEWTQSHLS